MKQVKTFADYMNDDERVSPAEREKINFEIDLIGKLIEARAVSYTHLDVYKRQI